jgi:beta-lactamase class A
MSADTIKRVLKIAVALLIGVIFGWLIGSRGASFQADQCKTDEFSHLSVRNNCLQRPVVSKRAYIDLKSKLTSYIEDKKTNGDIGHVSIYFRDLERGPTLGMDEHTAFSPASLLKLPMMITYYQLAEEQPGLLDTTVTINSNFNEHFQFFPPSKTLQGGQQYTLDELVTRMIKYSDNQAYFFLRDYLQVLAPNEDRLGKTFIALGIIDPKDDLDQTLSVKTYASIFVQLYNSTFFNDEAWSEKALAVLAEAEFDRGLRQGIPTNLELAHKFGERTNLSENLNQLHDCGIVYYPNNPYLLCIMSQGRDFNKLSETIGEISQMVYEEFDSRKQ